MTEQREPGAEAPRQAGDPRRQDRRRGDRRRDDRRAPVPFWRRPAAYAAYGVVGALLLVLILRGFTGRQDGPAGPGAGMAGTTAEAFPVATLPPGAVTREALTIGQYERLLAEGEAAVGEIVRTELYCSSINPVSIRETERAHPGLVQLADSEGRVAAAECRWSRAARSADFLLIVPPDLAEEFARAPEVELNFVRRRQVFAHLEWLGRSDALALRNAGILREIYTPS